MSSGCIDIDTVMTVAHLVHYMPQACLKIPMPLINCNVNNALVSDILPCQMRISVYSHYTTAADKPTAGRHPINCTGPD